MCPTNRIIAVESLPPPSTMSSQVSFPDAPRIGLAASTSQPLSATKQSKATKSTIHVWGEDKTPLSSDAIGPHSELCLQVRVKNLYFQSGSIGCVLECQDALLSSTAAECPWGEAMEE